MSGSDSLNAVVILPVQPHWGRAADVGHVCVHGPTATGKLGLYPWLVLPQDVIGTIRHATEAECFIDRLVCY